MSKKEPDPVVAEGTRFVLTRVSSDEHDRFDQDVALVRVSHAAGALLLARLARSKRIKTEDDEGLYAVEYWTGDVLFAQADELVRLVRKGHEAGHEAAEEVAAAIEAFTDGDAEVACVHDREACVAHVIDDYQVDGETRLSCVTVVVTEDTFVFTALAKHGGGRIESQTLHESHIRWLAGEAGPAPAAG